MTRGHPRPVSAARHLIPLASGLIAALPLSAWGATPAPKTVPAAAPILATTPVPDPVPAQADASPGVSGFRSARFGMVESDVRAAIGKDFGQSGEVVKGADNLSQQTHVLTIRVPDVLPGGGTAEVAYVFGYKSKQLIQIGVVWSKATDSAMTPERLYSNGNILRAHFLEAGDYKTDSVISDAATKTGLLMFRGLDAAGHATVLLLQGPMTPAAAGTEKDKRVLTPASLSLFYLADTKNPDVYRLAPGQF